VAKLGRRKTIDPSHADKYRRVGEALLDSADSLATIADEDDQFGNAIAIVAIHACIAYADALAISHAGFKSTDGDHTRAADVVQDALGSRADAQALKALRSALQRKDTVSYSGTYYRISDSERLLRDAKAFCAWAEGAYENRPRR
jgi:hypothetical protein